jgi:hypothetical protein
LLVAVSKSGSALEYIPEALKSPELIEAAIAMTARSIGIHPGEAYKTPELYLRVVNGRHSGRAMGYVSAWFLTREFC